MFSIRFKQTRSKLYQNCVNIMIGLPNYSYIDGFYNTIVVGQDYIEESNKRYRERLANKEKALLEKLAKKHNSTLRPVVS